MIELLLLPFKIIGWILKMIFKLAWGIIALGLSLIGLGGLLGGGSTNPHDDTGWSE